jgi:hypothetical protein
MSDKVLLDFKKGREKTNEGLYGLLVQNVRWVVIAKGGSLIPCVSAEAFTVIHKRLPVIMRELRYQQAHQWTGKLDGNAWRLSHGNDMDYLPEFNVSNKIFANTRDDTRSVEDHKLQQFQEYDVNRLTGGSDSKEVDDSGAMRIIVDECFQHVYFTIEHYRPTIEGKITKSQKSGQAKVEAASPYIFVLFEMPLEEVQSKVKSKKATKSPLDEAFEANNITETMLNSRCLKAMFRGQEVTVINPAVQKRGRSGSFAIPKPPETPQPTTLMELAQWFRLPTGAVDHAAMVLGVDTDAFPTRDEWTRILMFLKAHYGVVPRKHI